MDRIENCILTNLRNPVLLKPFIDDVKSTSYRVYKGYHPGADVKGTECYAICHCVCTYVGFNQSEKHIVVLQYDHNISFRYTNLTSVEVHLGDLVTQESKIGDCYQYVHIEALDDLSKSKWPVRVMDRTYWKHDPLPYLNGSFEFDLRSQYPVSTGEVDPRYLSWKDEYAFKNTDVLDDV